MLRAKAADGRGERVCPTGDREGEAVGAPFLRARVSVAKRRHREPDPAGDKGDERQRGQVAGNQTGCAPSRRPAWPRRAGEQIIGQPQRQRQQQGVERQRSPEIVVGVVAELVCGDDRDLVVGPVADQL